MEELKNDLKGISSEIAAYIKTEVDIFKLQVLEAVSGMLASAFNMIVVLVLATLFVVLISITAALAIGQWLDSYVYGFLIVSGVYMLLAVMCVFLRDTLVIKPMQNAIIKMIAEKLKS